jgi:ribonuclease D
VPNGFERSRAGGEVLAAIDARARARSQDLPRLERERGRATNGAVLDLLKVLLKAVADAERVAPKIIASSDDLEAIANRR